MPQLKFQMVAMQAWEKDLELLVRWLCMEGHSHPVKCCTQLGTQANRMLKQNGITCRSDDAVTQKIRSLKRAVVSARKIITEAGRRTLDECDASTRRYILKFCPFFKELDPVIAGLRFANASAQDPLSQAAAERVESTRSSSVGTRARAKSMECTDARDETLPATIKTKFTEDEQLERGVKREELILRLTVKRALARKELLDAGIAREEIERILPIQQYISLS